MDKNYINRMTVDSDTYQVWDGNMYLANYYATVTAASSQDFLIVTGATPTHAKVNISVDGISLITLYENVTLTALMGAGSTITSIYNMNRNNTGSCGATFFKEPAWSTNTEKIIFRKILNSYNNTCVIGGDARGGSEYVLKNSTQYLLRITNNDAATITATWAMEFFEQTI